MTDFPDIVRQARDWLAWWPGPPDAAHMPPEPNRDELCVALIAADDFLRSEDYDRCDMPACNCGLWHKRGPREDR